MSIIHVIFDWISQNAMFLISILSILTSIYIARYTIKSGLQTQIKLNELDRLINSINYLTRKHQLYVTLFQVLSIETRKDILKWKIGTILEIFKELGDLEKKHLNTFFIYESILPPIDYDERKAIERIFSIINTLTCLCNVMEINNYSLTEIENNFNECNTILQQEQMYTKRCIDVLKHEYKQRKGS